MLFWECKNSEEFDGFLKWLMDVDKYAYPISFYLNGIVYMMQDYKMASMFVLGIHAAADYGKYEKKFR